jgi:hypothetical protein
LKSPDVNVFLRGGGAFGIPLIYGGCFGFYGVYVANKSREKNTKPETIMTYVGGDFRGRLSSRFGTVSELNKQWGAIPLS